MKKILLFLISVIISISFFSCSVSSRDTSEQIIEMIETIGLKEIDQNFYQDLKSYDYHGDAYYLLGEKNEYIELVMYYKQKYVQLIIEFDVIDDTSLIVEQIKVEYFDLLDEMYVNFDVYDEMNSYDLNEKSYEDFFIELEALSISDIEWMLTSLNLM
ncbi:MAG: hypothetical protein PF513_00985 [Tenericutes bacterium]|nr:hypothetical protein [Mycoplasmatota bacterium]